MNRDGFNQDDNLDKLLESARKQTLPEAEERAIAERVWARLDEELVGTGAEGKTHALSGCGDFQALLPAYLAGELDERKTLLFEDHTRECIPCRKALMKARAGEVSAPETPRRRHAFALTRYGSIAAAFIAVVLIGIFAWNQMPLLGAGMTLVSLEGQAFELTDDGSVPLSEGATLERGQKIRTGRESSAFIELSDGSIVELSPRAQISIDERRSGTTIDLERGNVIVEAAEQRRGRLYVATDDCMVSVTGTVFSVKSGTKGSRVSVIEGEVRVDQGSQEDVLRPGDQISTHPSLGLVSIEEEIAWSQNLDQHLALLEEFVELSREIQAGLRRPELRHETRLLELCQPNTVFYFAMPNVAQNVVDAHEILRDRIEQSPVLSAWWREQAANAEIEQQIASAVAMIGAYGETLGSEIVISAAGDETAVAHQPAPLDVLMLAPLKDAESFAALVDDGLARLAEEQAPTVGLHIIDDPLTATPLPDGRQGLYTWIETDLVAASTSLPALRDLALRREGQAAGFSKTPFYEEIARSYREGVSWIVGADLERILAASTAASATHDEALFLEALGLSDLERLIAEHKTLDGDTVDRARVTFKNPRRGLAGLLAEPAPMGALGFLSPESNVALAVALREPSVLAVEWFAMLEAMNPGFLEEKRRLERERGIDLVEDFARKLGGEIVVAVDGPVLPTPAWKVVLEVYDPAGFQQSLEWIVGEINSADLQGTGTSPMRIETFTIGAREAYTIHLPGDIFEIDYAFADGYLVAVPNRAMLERALRFYDAGSRLVDTPRFLNTLPADGHADFSALLYQDLGSKLGPLVSGFASANQNLTPEQRETLQRLGAQTPATMVYAYAEESRISLGHSSPEGAIDAGTIIGLMGTLGVQDMLNSAGGAVDVPPADEAP